MQKSFFIIIVLLLIIAMSSCGNLSSQNLFKEQVWSENYAKADGVKSTSPEIIDGDMNTVGKILFPEGIYGKPVVGAFPNAEAIITLPEKKNISKIVIRSDNLPDFKVLASVGIVGGKEDWRLIKEFTNSKLKEIIIRTSVQTDKILIRARGIAPISSTESTRVMGGVVTSRKVMEPEIREIELYGFESKNDKNQSSTTF
jgi:hypothetical protein